ncbi:MAG: Smr/MutS family protein, partial [Lachnospiraceae bacterium]|nr:Smr/MutS family protein [Lachnospiraceae bacterium]
HLPTVRIVHGKGEGILRQAVRQYLKTVRYVKSYKAGEFGEGDSGVTVVTFK